MKKMLLTILGITATGVSILGLTVFVIWAILPSKPAQYICDKHVDIYYFVIPGWVDSKNRLTSNYEESKKLAGDYPMFIVNECTESHWE